MFLYLNPLYGFVLSFVGISEFLFRGKGREVLHRVVRGFACILCVFYRIKNFRYYYSLKCFFSLPSIYAYKLLVLLLNNSITLLLGAKTLPLVDAISPTVNHSSLAHSSSDSPNPSSSSSSSVIVAISLKKGQFLKFT